MTGLKKILATRIDGIVDHSEVTGAVVSLYRVADGFAFSHGSGDLAPSTPYFAASTTKLYVTAVLLQLREEGRVCFDQSIEAYLPAEVVAGLHVWKGKDLSREITLRMLMRQTSGLPDYFQHKAYGKTLQSRVSAGEDIAFNGEQALAWARAMTPHYPPGTGRRAKYSDTNYVLQGMIIEAVEGAPINDVMARRLFKPMGFGATWLYSDPTDLRPVLPRSGKNELEIRRTMASFQADGGLVTSSDEALAFLRAFFGGQFFPVERLKETYDWRPMFFPLSYGTGVERMALPRIMTGFRRGPVLVGKAGLTGAFLFAELDQGIFLSGTVNQIRNPGRCFRLMHALISDLQTQRDSG